jgi:hypothetical protein
VKAGRGGGGLAVSELIAAADPDAIAADVTGGDDERDDEAAAAVTTGSEGSAAYTGEATEEWSATAAGDADDENAAMKVDPFDGAGAQKILDDEYSGGERCGLESGSACMDKIRGVRDTPELGPAATPMCGVKLVGSNAPLLLPPPASPSSCMNEWMVAIGTGDSERWWACGSNGGNKLGLALRIVELLAAAARSSADDVGIGGTGGGGDCCGTNDEDPTATERGVGTGGTGGGGGGGERATEP